MSNRKLVSTTFLLIAFIYLSTSFIQFEFDKEDRVSSIGFDLPRILSGDEPHYLVFVYSLLEDNDFNLGNNYFKAAAGDSCSTGLKFRGKQIPSRINYFKEDRVLDIKNMYSGKGRILTDTELMRGEIRGFPIIAFLFPLLLASISFFISTQSCIIESVIILSNILITFIGIYILFKILMVYISKKEALFVIFSVAFGSPLWLYSKTLYPNTYIATILIASFYLIVYKNKLVLPSILLGAGYLIRYPTLIPLFFFWLYILMTRSKKEIFIFSVAPVISELILLFYNSLILGTPFSISQSYSTGNIFTGIYFMLFDWSYGLLIFMPIVMFFFSGFKSWYKKDKNAAILCFAIILSTFLFYSAGISLSGSVYGNRYLTDIILLMSIPIGIAYGSLKNKTTKIIFKFFAAAGILVNIIGGIFPALALNKGPIELLKYAWEIKYEVINFLLS